MIISLFYAGPDAIGLNLGLHADNFLVIAIHFNKSRDLIELPSDPRDHHMTDRKSSNSMVRINYPFAHLDPPFCEYHSVVEY